MYETKKLMESIITGKEKEVSQNDLIKQYQSKLSSNILAFMFIDNFGAIIQIGKLYPILAMEDKASFCLQELDKALRNFDINNDIRFITYFYRCLKNRYRMETEQLLGYKRKIQLLSMSLNEVEYDKYSQEDIEIEDEEELLNNYELSQEEKEQCRLLNKGYSIKEIASKFNNTLTQVYYRNNLIKQKILNSF